MSDLEWVRRDGVGRWEAEAGGGGSVPKAAVYSGQNASIESGATAKLDWQNIDWGDALLDVTDPFNPTALAAGIYQVSVWVKSSPLTVGGWFSVDLVLDVNVGAAEIVNDSPADTTGDGRSVCCSAGAFIPAGGAIQLLVSNLDGVATRDFSLHNATIVFIPEV